MAMGKKKRRSQKDLWVATSEIPVPPGHPFYEALEDLLKEHHFDDFVEQRCAKFYAERMGRPSVEPGVYFRLLLVGYFEGLGSERGIAWRAADSLALREFLGLKLSESPPDHSTLSRTRRLIDVETHGAVFGWVLARVGEAELLKGKTLGIDATTLEANAALRSIVRRDSGEGYEEFLKGLAQASGETFCPSLPHRRNATDRGQRALERHQTTADSGRCIQSGDGSAEASRCRDSQGPAGPGSSRNVAGFRPLLRHETADGRDGKLLRTVPDTDLFHPSRTGIPFPLKLGTFATGC